VLRCVRRPKTEDELEEFGEHGIAGVERNLPRSIIDAVRKRKGLAIEEKVVMFAEKQRTLNKKK
jgi:ribosome assembly protein 1